MYVFDRYHRWVATCCIANSNSFFLFFRAQGFETSPFPLFPGPKLGDARNFHCLPSVCKRAENAAKNTNFRKIGGPTDFSKIAVFFGVLRRFLRACKRSASSVNFGCLKPLDLETEDNWRPRDGTLGGVRVGAAARPIKI